MIAVRLPDGRKINVQTTDPQEAARAGRRLLAREAILKGPQGTKRADTGAGAQFTDSAVNGATLGLSDVLSGGATAGITALKNLALRAQGKTPTYGAGDAYAAERGLLKENEAAHPIASTAGGLFGGLGMPGGAEAAGFIDKGAQGLKTGAGLLDGLLTGSGKAAKIGRGILTAAPLSAVSGAANANPGEELQGAGTGAAVGAGLSLALPAVAGAAGMAASAAKGAGTTLARAANKATGGKLMDPVVTATKRLTDALKADGATPADLRAALGGFLRNGATDPSLVDVASRLPSGGQNTLALVRAAAAKGSGRGVAVNYGNQVAADLQDKAIARTRALTPDTRPVGVVGAAAKAARKIGADANYRAPYATPVDAAPVLPALEGDAGRMAIAAAHKDADALGLTDQMAELAKLKAAVGPEDAPVASIAGETLSDSPGLAAKIRAALGAKDENVPVSLGTLDRLKIALNNAGKGAAKADQSARAGGYFSRAAQIDDHLASVNPDYAAARDNYARASAGLDALDHGGTGLSASPDDYEATLAALKAKGDVNASDLAAIGYRGALTDAIGAPTEGAKGALNRISTSTNQKRNLSATFGDQAAEDYRGGIRDLANQARNADFINPTTGSATAGRLADMGLVEPSDVSVPRLGPMHAVMGLINKVRAGATLTDGEREAIVHLGISQPDAASLDRFQPDPTAILDALKRSGAYLTPAVASYSAREAGQ